MNLKTPQLTIAGVIVTLGLSVANSGAALLLSFTEEGGDVVMRTTGSILVGLSPIVSAGSVSYSDSIDDTFNTDIVGNVQTFRGAKTANAQTDFYSKIYFKSSNVGITSGRGFGLYVGTIMVEGGNGLFPGENSDGTMNPAIFELSGGTEVTYTEAKYSDIGMDLVAKDTTIDVWQGANAGIDGLVQIRIESGAIPEPNSLTLLSIGSLALVSRRRRSKVYSKKGYHLKLSKLPRFSSNTSL